MIFFELQKLIPNPVLFLGLLGFFSLLGALPWAFWSASSSRTSSIVRIFVVFANLCLTTQLVLRWLETGHFPISNLYESLCFLAWAGTFTQLLVERSWPSPLIAAWVTPISLLSVGFASFALPDHLQLGTPLVPALRSSWLIMHVSVIMSSYAALLIGSLLSLAVLFIDREESLIIRSNAVGVGGFRSDLSVKSLTSENSFKMSEIYLSKSEQLDTLSYRTITVGFLLLTIGLISGAVWANEAWGSWWSWDPKETWALISWLIYAAYLHTRLVRGWQGRRPAIVAVSGLIVIVICYLGVNLMGIGLHSYGWFL